MENLSNTIITTTGDAIGSIISFIPNLISGFVILLVGWAVATVVKTIAGRAFSLFNSEALFKRAGMEKSSTLKAWPAIAAQVVYWVIFLTFLIPAFSAWQLPAITGLLNQFLAYLPNVFAAVVIGFVGFVLARISFDVVRNVSKTLGSSASNLLGNVARYSLLTFAALAALNQLGIASNLIQILLTGLVAMMAIAGGLAFGLGGQQTASDILSRLTNRRSAKRFATQRGAIYASEIRIRRKAAKTLGKKRKIKKAVQNFPTTS